MSFTSLNFSESWLKADQDGRVDMSQYPINGYQPFAAPAVCSKHGGVVTYVKDFLEVEEKLIHGSRFWDGIFLLVKGENVKPFILCNIPSRYVNLQFPLSVFEPPPPSQYQIKLQKYPSPT